MDQLNLNPGSRLQHTRFGPGVIVAVKYGTYLISFINQGLLEIDKTDEQLEEIISEQLPEAPAVIPAYEKSLLGILEMWNGIGAPVKIADKWRGGKLLLQPGNADLQSKEVPIDVFFHKIVMLRDRLRVLEQNINSHKKLDEMDKIDLQQYITRAYGALTTFNILFADKDYLFVGEKSK